MKWRHWSILIVLVLLNYVIFSTAFTQLVKQQHPGPRHTRTPKPTFESIDPGPVAWIVLPTSTPRPTRTPVTPTPTTMLPAPDELASTIPSTVAALSPDATVLPSPTATPLPPTPTPAVTHVVKEGETLSEIAGRYNIPVQAIVDANGLGNPSHIITGQELTIPVSAEALPTSTVSPQATRTPKPKPPTPKPTKKPPTSTPKPAKPKYQFTAEIIWDPLVAPNCAGPGISKHSMIKDISGNPVNGVVVQVDCYGNKWAARPSGNPGEYEPGHYDFAFGQQSPQDWTCSVRVLSFNSQPVNASQVIAVHFDTNDCKPHGTGHQIAIVNWTKHW